jgi:hypothetical protein
MYDAQPDPWRTKAFYVELSAGLLAAAAAGILVPRAAEWLQERSDRSH